MGSSSDSHAFERHSLPYWMEQTLNNSPDAFLVLDRDFKITFVNSAAERLIGQPFEALRSARLRDAFPEAVDGVFYREYQRAMDSGESVEFQAHMAPLDKWFDVKVFPREAGLAICLSDVTKRKQQEQALARDARQTQLILDNAMEGIISIDSEGRIESFNKTAERIFGYRADDVLGQSVTVLMPEPYRADFQRHLHEFVRSGHPVLAGSGKEVKGRRRNGEVFPLELAITELKEPGHHLFIGMVRDLTEKKKREEAIHHLAHFDTLTGLPNRTQLWLDIEHKLDNTPQPDEWFALAVIDLDNFKDLNDAYGHKVGDLLLLQATQRMQRLVGNGYTLARLSGDEFVVLTPNLGRDRKQAALRAQTLLEPLRAQLAEPYLIGDTEHTVTASIGVTLFAQSIERVEDAVRQADLAMYDAKKSGRNHLSFYHDEMQQKVSRRAGIDSAMRQALKNREFTLLYQPQLNRRREVLGVEALIRWNRSDGKQVSPFDFIPIAEETGFIIELGHWILHQALTQLAHWQHRPSTRGLHMSVNISARQFRRPHFASEVISVLRDTGANAAQLTLELTESHLLQDAETVLHNLMVLKDKGVLFSLDDFGTGYSSLSYLKRFPIGEIKIDKSFVLGALQNTNDAAIVRAITQIGKAMNISVVAEGVETADHLKFLNELGCPVFQGYYFAKPMPAGDLEAGMAVDHSLRRWA